ncbi:hypothetical protein HK096_001157 [Nowakowskiella sp. JEL0078]|nr:hypothetical protein HK096_001157 [Nowakowskiella sp. JEL0078]
MTSIPLSNQPFSHYSRNKRSFEEEADAEDFLFYQSNSPIDDEEPLLGRIQQEDSEIDDENSDIFDEDDLTIRRKIIRGLKPSLGLLFMVTASLFFATMNLSVKVMSTSSEKLSPFEIIFLRSGTVYFMSVGVMKLLKISDPWFGPPRVRYQLILRGFLGWGNLACGYTALTFLTLGDSTVVGFLSPTLTGFLAFIILREKWNLIDACASIFSLLGVVFIARPPFIFGDSGNSETNEEKVFLLQSDKEYNPHTLGVIFALMGAVFNSFAFIALRGLSRKISILHSVSSLSYVGMILSLMSWPILYFFTPYPQHWVFPIMPETYFWLLVLGICGFMGQLLVSRAVQLETAAKAATISYTQVLFAFLLEWLYFKTIPSLWSLVGAIVIGSSVIVVAVANISGSTASAAAASGGLEGAGALFEGHDRIPGDLETEILPFAVSTEIPQPYLNFEEWDWQVLLRELGERLEIESDQ